VYKGMLMNLTFLEVKDAIYALVVYICNYTVVLKTNGCLIHAEYCRQSRK